MPHLASVLKNALLHKGFALVDMLSPCVTFNKVNTYEWLRSRICKLEDIRHDPSDYFAAYRKALEWPSEDPSGGKPIGILYRVENMPTFELLGTSPAEAPSQI